MIFIGLRSAAVLMCGAAFLLLTSNFGFAQTRSSVGQFFVSVNLNGAGSAVAPAGSCVSQTLFNQLGAVVRVTCLNNPFVSIAPSIDTRFPGTFGSTFRYPLFSSSSSYDLALTSVNSFNPTNSDLNNVSASSPTDGESKQTTSSAQSSPTSNENGRNFYSPTTTVTDLSIYRTAPLGTTDVQGLMDMLISF